MAKTETVTIDGVEHDINDLNDNAKLMVQHIADLDRKLASMRFNMDQIQVGREAFITMLKSQLSAKDGG
jgi:hypothetical protein